MTFNPDAATVYADGPTAYPYYPSKPAIRALLTQYETVMNAFTTNGGLIFATKALMDAQAATYTEPRSAWVYADPTAANNGVYVLDPATDTWTRVMRLPYDFVIGTDLGAGTANAIQIVTDIPVSDGMIVAFSLFEATTASLVTLSINGAAAITLVTNRGNNASALTAGMEIWGRYRASDSTLRLLNDQDVSALVAQAEGALSQLQAEKGAPNGVATLDGTGKVPAAQLPSYVDDVLEFANYAALPVTGEAGKIYVTLDTNNEYRWSGSAYIEIVASPGSTDEVAEGTTNLYHTAARVRDTLLDGLSTAVNAVIAAGDNVLSALGKLQAQVSSKAPIDSPVLTTAAKLTGTGSPKLEVEATDASTPYVRLRRGTSFFDIAFNTEGKLVVNNYSVDGNFIGQPFVIHGNNLIETSEGLQVHGDLRAYTQFFFGYGLATGGLSSLGMFVSGVGNNNVTIAGTNGTGGWQWASALEWRSDLLTWNFNSRPTWNGVGLATVEEAAGGGTGVAGVSSFKGRTGAVIPMANDYTSLQIAHGAANVEAVIVDLYNKAPFYTPERHGAVGDGVTDDGPALQAMLDILPNGGSIVVLKGQYKCNQKLTLSKSGVRFIGSPANTSVEGSWIKFGDLSAIADDCFIVNAGATTFDGIGFYLESGPGATYNIMRINGSNTRINHCTFTMPVTIAGRCGGVWFMHGNRLRMSDCRFVNISGYANLLQSSVHPNATTRGSTSNTPDILETERNIFTGVNGDFQTKGVVCGGNGGSYLDSGNVYLFLEYGFLATEVLGQNSSFFWLRSKGYETIQKDAIRLNSGAQAIIQGTYIGQSGQTYQDANGVGIVAAGTFGGGIIINGCEIRGQKRHGINIACSNATVTGNYVTECNTSGQASTYGIQMSGGSGYVCSGNNFNSINDPAGTTAHSYDINVIPAIATRATVVGNMCPKGYRYSTGVAVSGNAGSGTAV
ncbi:MAG TPA: glycosyl hydrolase family 28-related protein [Rhizobium sp.]|nr:glycosyl hydrolase family 28-related protein [Rhizobium sp.]